MPRYFTKDHEWIEIEGDTATVGITHYAQSQLGDITFVDLPVLGKSFAKGDCAVVIDSVKAAADVYAPLAGTICAVNEALGAEPELVNTMPEADGWLFKVTLADDHHISDMMDTSAYHAYIAEL